jgi:(1->4)-alpha-D-glucan 1-alpha-D-glucosylmutase
MILQMLAGSLPAGFDPTNGDALRDFRARLGAAVRKSVREAKVHTNWSRPDEAYERSVEKMVDRILDPAPDGFLAGFLPIQARIEGIGRRNALVQTALKLTIPGVPDIYQGAELWELSMVDPDNRRPVDYATRLRLLDEVEGRSVGDLVDRADGAGKLALTTRLLGLRRRFPALFSDGTYRPLDVDGDPRIVAFERRHGDASLVVVANRWAGAPPRGRMPLPDRRGGWTDVLTDERVPDPGGFDLARLADPFPIAVLLARRIDAGADR